MLIKPRATETAADAEPVADTPKEGPTPPLLERGSVLARALYAIFDGDERVLLKSPPGAGKTTFVVDLVHWLLAHSDLSVAVVAFTNEAVRDLAGRMARGWEEGQHPWVVTAVKKGAYAIPGTASSVTSAAERSVACRTVASCRTKPPHVDVLIVDEAYQTTFADMRLATANAKQVVMVGDPGQIGPVVTTNPYMLDHHHKGKTTSPAASAPDAYEVLASGDGQTVLAFEHSYRLGQDTVDVIAPLYDFRFVSRRPDRWIASPDGRAYPEIVAKTVTEPVRNHVDVDLMQVVVDQVTRLRGSAVVEKQPDGSLVEAQLRQRDIAVVVGYREQREMISAMLEAEGMSAITVGTANSLQGGQWHAVIALDPATGGASIAAHQLDPGRLCVMASRHSAHLTWITDDQWEQALTEIIDDPETEPEHVKWAELGIEVRRNLVAAGKEN